MSQSTSGNRTHDITVAVAEATRQVACTPNMTQANVRAAEITFYRACVASAIANGISPQQFQTALMELGTK